MDILYVTFEKPSRKSGGGLVVLQSLISLSAHNDIYYIGPEFDIDDFANIKLKEYHFLEIENSLLNRIRYKFKSIPHHYYNSWKTISEKLIQTRLFDLCYIEFTRYSDVVRFAKKHNMKVYVRVHNIEYDYYSKISKSKGINKRKLYAIFDKNLVKKHEQYVTSTADKLIFLTRLDQNISKSYYGNRNNGTVIPVCLLHDSTHEVMPFKYQDKYVLLTGSYWYTPNAEGAIWFLEEVWSKIQEKLNGIGVVIAGSRPSKDLKAICEKYDSCLLVESPEDMAPYFLGASLYVAPIFDGAGMKVKVAESLSYGLPLIGTEHALIGYDNAMSVCVMANRPEEYRESIVRLFTSEGGLKSRNAVRGVFENNYSINASIKAYEIIL